MTINFSPGSSLTLSQAPRKVINPLIIPPHEGAISMIEKVTPKACTQSGSALNKQMVWSGPHVQKYQRPEMDNRELVGVDRPAGSFRQIIVHQAQKRGCQKKGHCIVPVPPLNNCILGTCINRITFEQGRPAVLSS